MMYEIGSSSHGCGVNVGSSSNSDLWGRKTRRRNKSGWLWFIWEKCFEFNIVERLSRFAHNVGILMSIVVRKVSMNSV